MKLKHLFLLLFAAVATASCSDDDTPENLADSVAGQYTGYTTAACAYFDGQVATDQTVAITPVVSATNQVSVIFTSDSYGTVTIPSATVAKQGNAYMLAGDGTAAMGMGGNTKEYACTFTGKIENGAPELTFSVPTVMGGLSIVFKTGDAPQTAE